MTGILAQLVSWLNTVANPLGELLLVPLGAMPGWASATLVGAVAGVLLLVVYKYTSPQRAVKRVRDDITANLLALKLFKDSAWVAVKSQGRLLRGAALLLLLGVVPMLVMLVPVSLLLAQMDLWYHAHPVPVGGDAVVTVKLNGNAGDAWPDVKLQPNDAVEVADGPYRIKSERKICWNVEAKQAGYHRLVFEVNGQPFDKELAVGDGTMRVSTLRPGWSWYEILENPGEKPFAPDSPVQAIDVEYEARDLRMNFLLFKLPWMVYWFIVSLVAGYCGSKVFNVNL